MSIQTKALHLVQSVLRSGKANTELSIESVFDIAQMKSLGKFSPHPDTAAIIEATLQWVDQIGFLTEANRGQVRAWASMNPFTHQGKQSAVELTGRLYGALFLMDDWLSNDAQDTYLNTEQKQYLGGLVKQFIGLLAQVANGANALALALQFPPVDAQSPAMASFQSKAETLFNACWRVFQEFALNTDQTFAQEFANLLGSHIKQGMKNQDEGILSTLDMAHYVSLRREVSGMKVGRKLTEYATNSYLGVRALRTLAAINPTPTVTQLLQQLEQLDERLDDFGGLGNDVFSVSKEVFRDSTIFNFVALSVLSVAPQEENQPHDLQQSFDGALALTQQKIHQITNDFAASVAGSKSNQSILNLINAISDADLGIEVGLSAAQLRQQLHAYIEGLVQYFLATYYWELDPNGGLPRYRHNDAIFVELQPVKA
jgi:Terpene synthase family 2, C-terminal metal binding